MGETGASAHLANQTRTKQYLSPELITMFRRTLLPGSKALRGVRHASTDSSQQTIRRFVLSGAVVLITVSGAVTGAKLKMDNDTAMQKKGFQDTSIDDRIAILEDRRSNLVSIKMPLEKKLADLRARMGAKEREEQQGGKGQ